MTGVDDRFVSLVHDIAESLPSYFPSPYAEEIVGNSTILI